MGDEVRNGGESVKIIEFLYSRKKDRWSTRFDTRKAPIHAIHPASSHVDAKITPQSTSYVRHIFPSGHQGPHNERMSSRRPCDPSLAMP